MKDLTMLLDELKDMSFFNKGDICLIGCSTSEVIGEKNRDCRFDGSCRNYF